MVDFNYFYTSGLLLLTYQEKWLENIHIHLLGLPELSTLGDKEKSERAAEVEQTDMSTNTSCSVFVSKKTTTTAPAAYNQEIFHLLIDAGEGVAKSLVWINWSNRRY